MSLSSPNRKHQPFPLLSYFSVVVCLRCLLHHILSLSAHTFRENQDIIFIIIAQFMMIWLQIVHIVGCVLACRSYLVVCRSHHLIITIVKTYLKTLNLKMPVRYILSSVWVRLSILSRLSIIQYMGLFVFSLPISLVMTERIHILCRIIIIKSEVWTIIQLFMVRWYALSLSILMYE